MVVSWMMSFWLTTSLREKSGSVSLSPLFRVFYGGLLDDVFLANNLPQDEKNMYAIGAIKVAPRAASTHTGAILQGNVKESFNSIKDTEASIIPPNILSGDSP
ncbi:uncharacterized protein LOC144772508 isoform X1 [Lissotriton helveticus]